MQEPTVTYRGLLDMQVCIPADWTDAQVKTFADSENPSGTTQGWQIRRQGDDALRGANERVPCSENPDFRHIMLDA